MGAQRPILSGYWKIHENEMEGCLKAVAHQLSPAIL
jgi:hypothetical protein